MSGKFRIKYRDYYNEGEYIFKKNNIEIHSGLTVLVGCNGIGKTTLLFEIKNQLKKKKIPFINFNNLVDGGGNAREEALYRSELDFLATTCCSSEGENIMLNIGNLAQNIRRSIKKYEDENEYWILLDAVDSGLSIDNIIELKEFFNLLIEDNKNKDIYILASANEYEMAREEQCFDVANCKYITFKDYEDYRNYIIKSREYKDKR